MKPRQAKVAIFMGSESDLPVMSKASELLSAYGIDAEHIAAAVRQLVHAAVAAS